MPDSDDELLRDDPAIPAPLKRALELRGQERMPEARRQALQESLRRATGGSEAPEAPTACPRPPLVPFAFAGAALLAALGLWLGNRGSEPAAHDAAAHDASMPSSPRPVTDAAPSGAAPSDASVPSTRPAVTDPGASSTRPVTDPAPPGAAPSDASASQGPAASSSAPPVSSASPTVSSSPARAADAAPRRPGVSSPGRVGTTPDDEIALIRRARAELDQGHARRSLELLGQHRRRFSHGLLEQEREVLAIDALVRLGRRRAARARAARFHRRFPDSALGSRVRSLVEDGDDPAPREATAPFDRTE